MSDSSTSSHLFVVLSLATVVCGFLMIWSFLSGTYVDETVVPEREFEQESFNDPHLTFELNRKTTVQLSFEGTTLDDSWVWIKALLVDSDNKVLGDYTVEMAEYDDENDDSWSKSIVLPKGQYKVLVHGEDAKRSQGWTDEHTERVRVEVQKDFVLTRYSLIGFILFGIGAFMAIGSSGSDSDEFEADFD